MNDWDEYINRSMECLMRKSDEFGFHVFLHGFNIGIVQFVSCPDGFDDVVCKIGDGWFYFAGTDGEGLTPFEYLYEVGIENALSQAYDYLLGGLEEVDSEEAAYYKAFLMEHRESMSMFVFHEYGVRVIQRDFEPYEESFKEFGADSHAALDFYRRCGNVKETCGIVSTVTAERKNEDGEWEVIFKREINGWF